MDLQDLVVAFKDAAKAKGVALASKSYDLKSVMKANLKANKLL